MTTARFSLALLATLLLAQPCFAEPARDAILGQLATEAKPANPAFAGFSVERGQAFWQAAHTGGKAETPSCTNCHTKDPTAEGRTRAGTGSQSVTHPRRRLDRIPSGARSRALDLSGDRT